MAVGARLEEPQKPQQKVRSRVRRLMASKLPCEVLLCNVFA